MTCEIKEDGLMEICAENSSESYVLELWCKAKDDRDLLKYFPERQKLGLTFYIWGRDENK